jgi:hypothetical protein
MQAAPTPNASECGLRSTGSVSPVAWRGPGGLSAGRASKPPVHGPDCPTDVDSDGCWHHSELQPGLSIRTPRQLSRTTVGRGRQHDPLGPASIRCVFQRGRASGPKREGETAASIESQKSGHTLATLHVATRRNPPSSKRQVSGREAHVPIFLSPAVTRGRRRKGRRRERRSGP